MNTVAAILVAGLCLSAWAAADAAVDQQAVVHSPSSVADDVDAVTIPRMLSYQGKLTDTLGIPVPDTTYSVNFRLYTVPSGGSAFWNETQTVRTKSGLFSVLLGSVTPIGSMPDAGAVYLGMAVAGGNELTPRLRIASAAYAYLTEHAANADLLQGRDTTTFSRSTHNHDATYVNEGQANSVTGAMITDGTVAAAELAGSAVTTDKVADTAVTMAKLARAGATTGEVIKWTGSYWEPGPDNTGGGTGVTNVYQDTGITCVPNPITSTGNVKLNLTFSDGRYVNEAQAAGGGLTGTYPSPTIAANAVSSGNITDGSVTSADIGDTAVNTAELKDAAVTAPKLNPMGATSGQVLKWTGSAWAPRNDSVGGGGTGDNAWVRGTPDSVLYTVRQLGIARGGSSNMLHGGLRQTHVNLGVACTTGTAGQNYLYCTVGGGYANAAVGNLAAVCGGSGNVATGAYSFVGGGMYDSARAAFGGALTGRQNTAGDDASDTSSVVCGGDFNTVRAKHSFIGGGRLNLVTGTGASVVGGGSNSAGGVYATVAGGSGNTAVDEFTSVGGGHNNSAGGDFATVSGGDSDTARGYAATIAGGSRNGAVQSYATVSGGRLNTASGVGAAVGGGQSNMAQDTCGFVGGGYTNHATGTYAAVGGGCGNAASGYAAMVGGGYHNLADTTYATVGGGYDNAATGTYATVGGGYHNEATYYSATIGGGFDNTATDEYATIGGGFNNTATDEYATVGGGAGNDVRGYAATIGGGTGNSADTSYATVGGGHANVASDIYAMVGGGYNNDASSGYAAVGGGYSNNASGGNATVGGGYYNTASGTSATVPGGAYNSARGAYSHAAGRYARANHNGGFVWSDHAASATESVYTTADNQFRVRARGGTWFFSNAGMSTGAYLAAGSNAWAAACDSATKEDFRPVDRKELLDKVAALRVRDYKMKDQNDGTRHIGPVAQDFHAAFGVGENNTSINMADADGVLFAAVQALYEQNQAQQAEIDALKAELAGKK